jgi:hypothetical protein
MTQQSEQSQQPRRRVLFGYDGTVFADNALHWALQSLQRSNDEWTVMCVVKEPSFPVFGPEALEFYIGVENVIKEQDLENRVLESLVSKVKALRKG